MIKKLLKRRIHVYPLDNTLFSDLWVEAEMNAIQAFFSDRRRYGWHVAVYNLIWILRN
jgi:hypothetical protein